MSDGVANRTVREIKSTVSGAMSMCNRCALTSCVQCQVPWHEGLSCEEWRNPMMKAHATEEKASHAAIKRTRKTCPKAGCGGVVQKISARDIVECESNSCTLCVIKY